MCIYSFWEKSGKHGVCGDFGCFGTLYIFQNKTEKSFLKDQKWKKHKNQRDGKIEIGLPNENKQEKTKRIETQRCDLETENIKGKEKKLK